MPFHVSLTSAAASGDAYDDEDIGHPLNGDTYHFVENDCGVFRTNAQGRWEDAALSDIL